MVKKEPDYPVLIKDESLIAEQIASMKNRIAKEKAMPDEKRNAILEILAAVENLIR